MAQLGDYGVDGLIGRGAVGTVYRARHRGSDDVIALKVVRWAGEEHVVDRLRRESAAIRSLGHPYILEVLDVTRDEAGLVVAMSLASSGSLADALGRRGDIPPGEAAALGAKVAGALAAVHALGIVHADVKPSNILMDDEGEPLLSDFGLSWHTAVLSQGEAGVVGTAEYLDPQVARGDSPSAASDIYSLGVVCYEMLAGRPPYRGATPLATLRLADGGGAKPLTEAAPSVPVGVAEVVERAMSRRPEQRPSTAVELGDALRAEIACGRHSTPADGAVPIGSTPAAAQDGAVGPRTIPPRRSSSDRRLQLQPPPRRSRLPVVALMLSMVLAALVFLPHMFRRGGGPRRLPVACQAVRTPASLQAASAASAVTVLAAVTASRCPVPVTWSAGTITVSLASNQPPARFALGQPGDELLLGDWDCRRAARPALYRPSTGQVFYFAAWARPGRDVQPSAIDATMVIDGVARVMQGDTRHCDRVEVATRTGTS